MLLLLLLFDLFSNDTIDFTLNFICQFIIKVALFIAYFIWLRHRVWVLNEEVVLLVPITWVGCKAVVKGTLTHLNFILL